MLAVLGMASLAGCGGGGGSSPAPTASSSAPAAADGAQSGQAAIPVASQVVPAPANAAAAPAATAAGAPPAGASAVTAPTPLAAFAYYRLGNPAQAGTASLSDGNLAVDGRQSNGAALVAGACNAGSAFSQCASAASANVFTLCSDDGGGGSGSDRLRSRYVLFDPTAERITDAAVLRNLSFSGYEDCGQNNVGAQPKSAPSATLSFNAAGDLTLVRYDQDPPRTSTLPAFFVNLTSDTVSGGQTARFNVYRNNGRYLIIATSAPTSGPTAADPGTLIAFVQN